MSSNARAHYQGLIADNVTQLITLHSNIQSGRGRRHQQDALHRAGIVLVVAAWESYVERLLDEAYAAITPGAGAGPHTLLPYQLSAARIPGRIESFNNPNRKNVQRLLRETLNFDPFPHWTWTAGVKTWTAAQARARLDEWVQIRHRVAHGNPLPTYPWILGNNGQPRLTLTHMRSCRGFFNAMVRATDSALRQHLVASFGVANPWPA
tara:strand:- start:1078 stop:1701 length:624 start_codon:yes stop_codon:yes gene_type:complete